MLRGGGEPPISAKGFLGKCYWNLKALFHVFVAVAIDKMALSHEKFSGQFFFPLLILTIFVTIESE